MCEWLRQNNSTSLNRQQLDQIITQQKQQPSNTKEPSYTPWIIGGIAVVALLAIVGVVVMRKRRKSKKDDKK